MYGVAVSRGRFKLFRTAMCMPRSSLSKHSENGIASDALSAEKAGPNSELSINSGQKCNPHAGDLSSNSAFECNPTPFCRGWSSIFTASEEAKRIWAVERLSKGKGYARHDKKRLRVPGFVVDKENPQVEHILILMDSFQIQSLWSHMGEEKFLSTVLSLEVFDGFGSQNILYKLPVLARRINYDKSGLICNIGFVKAPNGVKIRLDTPIRIIQQEHCIGMKKGGCLKVYLKYASLFCSAEELPPSLQIDVTRMDINDKVCLGDLNLGALLHSSNEPSTVICEVV